jgi:aspartyl-tRNA synthetase
MHRYRTHTCGELRETHVGETVRLSGWSHRIRDHGGVLFIDLRDHYGITQCVADPDSPAFKAAENVRSEWVVRIDGKVRRRPPGTENRDLPSGMIEVFITDLEVLGPAAELPMPVFGEHDYPEETRLRYRFLDLRRDKLHANIMTRGAIIDSIRRRMKEGGFFEFQTPILTASSPEGARDFLVPSRLHPGKFYALPQAPQQFKQLIMIAGFDRYFQIAPCFRDEDARADRSPGEFYQLDIEMSFVTQEDVFQAVEPVLRGVFEEFADGKPVTRTFPRIPYAEAMLKYGSDKPDLRNPLVIADVTEEFARDAVTFNAFKNVIKAGGVVRAIPATGAAAQPRSFFDKLNDWARGEGAPGLGYIVFESEGGALSGKGPIAKFIPSDVQAAIAAKAGVGPGDAVFFSAGEVSKAATRMRAFPASRTSSRSAGSPISRCTNGTRTRSASTFRTTRSRCRTMTMTPSWRWTRMTGTRSSASPRSSTMSSATASSCRPARSAITGPTSWRRRLPSPATAPRCSSRSSAACCALCNMARRRTEASRRASTAS